MKKRPDVPPPEAAKFPPAEFFQRDDGVLYRMVPSWKEIRRVTEWSDRNEIDRKLGLPVGTVEGYCKGPIVLPDRIAISFPPTKEVVNAIYEAAGEDAPELTIQMQARPAQGGPMALDGVSHIGVRERKEPAGF